MGKKPQQSDQDIQMQQDLAESKRKEAEEKKKLEAERIAGERARFSGGGSLMSQDQKDGLGG